MSTPTRTVIDPTGVSACATAAPIAAVTPQPGAQAILLPPSRKVSVVAMCCAMAQGEAPIVALDPGIAAAGVAVAMSFPPSYNKRRPFKTGRLFPTGARV